uniref:Uncharacterized protein n=1 Tax=Arundo donax TaxID=35708 RepID=A0A0A8ZD94_ARUDO
MVNTMIFLEFLKIHLGPLFLETEVATLCFITTLASHPVHMCMYGHNSFQFACALSTLQHTVVSGLPQYVNGNINQAGYLY